MDDLPVPDRPVDIGDRVETTGIALVHEGDYVVPAPGSVARLAVEPAADDDLPPAQAEGPDEVHYWFPVEIEVIGSVDAGTADAIVARVYEELGRELASRS